MENEWPIPKDLQWMTIKGYAKWLGYWQRGIEQKDIVNDPNMQNFDPMKKIRQLSNGWIYEEVCIDSIWGCRWLHPDQVGEFGESDVDPDLIDDLGLKYEVKSMPPCEKLHIKKTKAHFYLMVVYGERYIYQIDSELIWKNGKCLFQTEAFYGHQSAVMTMKDFIGLGRPIAIKSPLVEIGA
jgi:hypothetical protein